MQKCLRVLRLAPIKKLATRNCANSRQFLLGTLESALFGYGLGSGGGQVAGLELESGRRLQEFRIPSATWRKGSPQDRATQCQPWKCGIELHGEGPSREQRTLQL